MNLELLVGEEEVGLGKLFLVLRSITQQSLTFFRSSFLYPKMSSFSQKRKFNFSLQ